MLSKLARWSLWLAWMLVLPVATAADVVGGEVVLAQNAQMTLTRADYEAALARMVPEERRLDFSTRPKQVNGLLNALLVRKTLAAEARAAGLDRDPLPQGADDDTVLAERFLARLDAGVQADFDRRIEAFTAKAREDYLVNRRAYMAPEEIEFSQVFVASAKHGEDAACRIADKVRTELLRGTGFPAMAREFSDDQVSASNGGRVSWTSRAALDPALAGTLFEMKAVGEVSEVVRTSSGCYVVRLEGRRAERQQTFDEAKEQILEKLKRAQVEAARKAKADAIHTDPGLRVNQPAIDALLTRVDPEVFRRALEAAPQSPSPK